MVKSEVKLEIVKTWGLKNLYTNFHPKDGLGVIVIAF